MSLSANFIVVTAHWAAHSLKFENKIDIYPPLADVDFIPTLSDLTLFVWFICVCFQVVALILCGLPVLQPVQPSVIILLSR